MCRIGLVSACLLLFGSLASGQDNALKFISPPPLDVGTPESCGVTNAVRCVLCGFGSDGRPDCGNSRGGVDGAECNSYVPATEADCTRPIK